MFRLLENREIWKDMVQVEKWRGDKEVSGINCWSLGNKPPCRFVCWARVFVFLCESSRILIFLYEGLLSKISILFQSNSWLMLILCSEMTEDDPHFLLIFKMCSLILVFNCFVFGLAVTAIYSIYYIVSRHQF